jgi:hypothetical protein
MPYNYVSSLLPIRSALFNILISCRSSHGRLDLSVFTHFYVKSRQLVDQLEIRQICLSFGIQRNNRDRAIRR